MLTQSNHYLDSHFELKEITFSNRVSASSPSEDFKRPVVIVKDLDCFVQSMLKERGYDPATALIKIGGDGGGEFFKLTLSIIDRHSTMNSPVKSARRTFNQGVAPEQAKDTSAKRMFLVALVPGISETYENMQLLLSNLNLMDVSFKLNMDLKLANIIFGLSAHGAAHPCCYCEARKESGEWAERGGVKRTLGNIRKHFENFHRAGAKLSSAKDYLNCIHEPLIPYDSSTYILELFPPPELHMLLGVFNDLYSGLEKSWSPEGLAEWTRPLGVKRAVWHGTAGSGHFQGGDCKKLLGSIDHLDSLTSLPQKRFVHALRALSKVVQGCFGMALSLSFSEDIEEFKQAFCATNLSVTTKVHILCVHVAEFCHQYKRGLGLYSEQGSESLHHEFAEFWLNYKTRDTNKRMPERLFAAVCAFNSHHI